MPSRGTKGLWRVIGVLSMITLSVQFVHASEPSVWVFTAQRLPRLQNVESADKVFVLDDADDALKNLAFNNPGSETQARQRAMAIIQSPKGQAALDRMRTSAEATTVAWQHGIQRLPAVLVDKQYVVYGLFDVEAALTKIARYRDAH